MHSVVAAVGFLIKELATVLGQPRLVAGLVLGPFLIMLIFGLGYRGPPPEFRTVLVLPDDPAIAGKVNAYDIYQQGLSGVFRLHKITRDEQQALAELRADQADVVVVVPDNLYERLADGERALLQVYYTETDPTSNAWVRYFTSVQTSELNRRILLELLRQTKRPLSEALQYADQAALELDAVEADVRAGDRERAAARVDALLAATEAVPEDAGALAGRLGGASNTAADETTLPALVRDLAALRLDLERADDVAALRRLEDARARVRRLHETARRVNAIPLETLVSPLAAEARNVAPVEPTPVAFYAPAVLALLLQHIGVTMGALSAVRDRLLGSMELFRVSPVGAGSILVGKSLAYAVLLAAIAAALTLALTALLAVPLLGDPRIFALGVGLTVFAAVGLGFALSTVAATESQAVQFSMVVLLASVFFGGFFLPTNLLFRWVLVVSYSLPVTYGASSLRDVMLRGGVPDLPLLAGPLLIGAVFYLIALLGLQRQMRRA